MWPISWRTVCFPWGVWRARYIFLIFRPSARHTWASTRPVSFVALIETPRIDKIELMANYFGISKADLVEDHKDLSDDHYYLNDETREIAQEVFENPDLRSLFHVARDIDPEELRAHIDFMKKMKAREKKADNDEGC